MIPTAATLDLTRLPPPVFVPGAKDHASLFSARIASLAARLAEQGITYDTGNLNSDPLAIVEQEDAYREMLDLQAIEDAGRARLLAFATGPRLEHIAAFFGVERLTDEDDDRLRKRVQFAPSTYGAAGSLGAYIFFALTADPRVRDAVALNHATPGIKPGEVVVVIHADDNAIDEVLTVCRKVLFADHVKALTDILSLRRAKSVPYTVKGRILIPYGPDPMLVKNEALGRLAAYAAGRRRIGASVASSGFDAALHVASAESVVDVTPNGVTIGPGEIADFKGAEITVEVVR